MKIKYGVVVNYYDLYYRNNNKLNGVDNAIKQIKTLKDDKLNGMFIKYCKNGILRDEMWIILNVNPEFYVQYNYEDNVLNGECIMWHTNKQIKIHYYAKDGQLNGEYKEWYNNGHLLKRCFYKNSKLQNEYTEYYKNGNIKIEANYVNDKLNNERKKYNLSGECKTTYYKDGKKIKEI